MEPFTQQELARMHAEAEICNERIEADRLRGGNPATVWNEVYDEAALVLAVWRKKRGGYGYLLVKGAEHCRRVIETGLAEPVRRALHAVPSPEVAIEIGRILDRNPNARWVYGTRHDGARVLGLEMASGSDGWREERTLPGAAERHRR